VVIPLSFWFSWRAAGLDFPKAAAAQTAESTGASIAHFDSARGTFVVPESEGLPKVRTESSAKGLRRLVQEAAPSPAGGFRVRLDDRFQSALAVTIVNGNPILDCRQSVNEPAASSGESHE
jgi:hypothetical protein